MDDKVFGESGSRVVRISNWSEISVLCFTDGKAIKPMVYRGP